MPGDRRIRMAGQTFRWVFIGQADPPSGLRPSAGLIGSPVTG